MSGFDSGNIRAKKTYFVRSVKVSVRAVVPENLGKGQNGEHQLLGLGRKGHALEILQVVLGDDRFQNRIESV